MKLWTLPGLLFAFTTSTVAAAVPGSQPAGQMIGQIGGPTQAVAAQGSYAYLGVGLRVIVLDVSDPTSPREVGSSPPFSDFVRDIAVSGTVAYVAAGGAGLRVVDVSDPARPAEIGSLQSRGYAEGVAVSGTTVCLAHGPYGLRVIDVSNPRSPTEISSAFTRNYAFKVAMAGAYAYVAAAGAGLLIADLTNRAAPSEVATLATPGYAYGLAVSGNTVYVAGGWEGLLTLDVTSKSQPRLLGQLRTASWAVGVTVSGTLAYVAAALGGLRVVNISDPARPTELGALAVVGGDAAGVAVAGTIAYVADRNWGMEALDLSAPASPVQVGFYGPLGYADGIVVAGNYAYVSAGPYGLRIIDISDPAWPRQVGAYDTQSYATSLAVAGNYAYVAGNSIGDGIGLHVVDIRDPARPVRAGFFSDGGPYHGMTLAGGIVYISKEVGLDLFDVSNPAAPRKLSYLPAHTDTDIGQNTAVGVAVSGNVAYVAVEQQGLFIVDVSNPSAPAAIGKFKWPDATAQDIVLARGMAFVADQSFLTVLDVSNPRAPVWLASYPTSGFEESLALAGDQVFVANGGAGLSVIDVSNPRSPALAWSYRTLGYAQSVSVRDDLIFVADSTGGLVILRKSGGGAATLAGVGTSHLVVSQGAIPRVAPPPVRVSAAPLPAARIVGVQAASSCVVTSTADSGVGTLRGCLERASGGTIITFDPAVFPPSRPTTIAPLSELPHILSGYVTLDASNAGVILDGSGMPPSTRGLAIGSSGNVIMGLQIVRFPSDGIILFGPRIKEGNLIGGSRNRGKGPLGEGNLISGNGGNGIGIADPQTTNTTITGNFIGTDITGTAAMGNRINGIFVYDSPNNRVGGSGPEERNVISGNSGYGIEVIASGSAGNSISGNYIGVDASGTKELSNGWTAVGLERGANANLVRGNVIVSTNRTCIVINDPGSSYNTVVGNSVGTDASGRVFLGSAVPAIGVGGGASFNRIGGTTPADRNVIAQGRIDFGRQGGPGNLVIGNFIGTDISGSMALATRESGIALADGSNRPFIGGTTAGERNVISGNPYGGIQVGNAADYTFIGGNYIGTDASGQRALGNGGSGGIVIRQGTHIIVQGNLIAHQNSGGAGITVSGYAGNTLRQNLIYDNQGGGIVLQDGGNAGVSAPAISSARPTGVSGTACPGCEVEIFSDSNGQGRIFEGTAVSDSSGAFTFAKSPGYLTGPNVTATSTDRDGSTSAFSMPVRVPLAITTSSPLPAGTIGMSYSVQLAATGATGSLTWSVVSGSLPGGLALSAGGQLLGTPSAVGSYVFTVKVSNSAGESAQGAFTLIIAACIAPAIATQPQGACVPTGQAATLSVTANGSSPFVYQWYRGVGGDTSNPVGLNAAAFTTPSVDATTSYWVRVSNACGHADSVTVTVNAVPATPVVSTLSTVGAGGQNLPASVPNHAGSTYQWAIVNGTITSGQGTNQITFTAGTAGPLTLSVVEINSFGCSSPQGKVDVSVVSQPLVLSHGRVGVSVDWRNPYSGETGTAYALWQGDEFGFFYYSDTNNPEVFVKVLDFGSGSALCFVGGLTDFYYKVTFTMLSTGQTLVFEKPEKQYVGFVDATTLKYAGAPGAPVESVVAGGMTFVGALATGDPVSDPKTGPAVTAKSKIGEPLAAAPQSLALSSGRVVVTVDWRNPYSGETGRAYGIPKADPFGFFYYTDASNPEVFVKVLDFGTGTALCFVGGLTDFYYKVTFTVLRTGLTLVFEKPEKQYIGFVDATTLKF